MKTFEQFLVENNIPEDAVKTVVSFHGRHGAALTIHHADGKQTTHHHSTVSAANTHAANVKKFNPNVKHEDWTE